MQQLSGLDALFVHKESHTTPMHISALLVYKQSSAPGGKVRFTDILASFEQNMHKSPIFRRKLHQVPLNLDQPYWIDDPDFDVEFHIRHIALPKPGDWRQLCILTSRLHARGLDMSKPLWEAWVIEGLDGVKRVPKGSFGIFLKVHHSGIDGVSAAEVIAAIHQLAPEAVEETIEEPWQAKNGPNTLQMAANTYINGFRRPWQLVKTLRNVVPAALQVNRDDDKGDAAKGKKPRTRFNHTVSGYRVADGILLDFKAVRAIKNSVEGATVNDVIVTVVGGALRKYLLDKDELPSAPLNGGAPINVRDKSDSNQDGNRISVMGMSLGTDIEDPVQRLQAVHSGSINAKSSASKLGKTSLVDVAEGMSARLSQFGLKAATAIALMPEGPVPFNVIISNVPGPPFPLYLAGAELHSIFGYGPIIDGMGLFHAVISNNGKISIMFASCRKMLPDPEFYAECLQASFDELEGATIGKKKRSTAKPKPKPKPKPKRKAKPA